MLGEASPLTCVTKYMYYGPERRWPFIVYSLGAVMIDTDTAI